LPGFCLTGLLIKIETSAEHVSFRFINDCNCSWSDENHFNLDQAIR
jgi:hypothetical protein